LIDLSAKNWYYGKNPLSKRKYSRKRDNMHFSEMNLIEPLLHAVDEAGYTEPTPIQEQTIKYVLDGDDVLGCAQTGTGKTAAFALPILQNLSKESRSGRIRSLILTPTRELAIQNYDSFVLYGKYLKLRCGVIFGGVGQGPQEDMLRGGIDILVATPGRLNDLIGQGLIKLDGIEIFVLDEADRMLDMGFIHDVKRVLEKLPKHRQTLMFSATMPPEIEKLADSMLHRPKTVKVDPVTSTVEAIDQCVYFVDKGNKKHLLAKVLRQDDLHSALVFTRTKHGADKVVKELDREGIEALAIHGNKSQRARQNALNSFKDGQIWVLVATDIAARGIDINELSHVINYDIPNEPETYIHRIGRTGRAGHAGSAVSFCCYDELEYLQDIEKLTGEKIPVKESEWPMVILEKTEKPAQSQRPPRAQREPRPPRTSSPRPQKPAEAARAPQKGQSLPDKGGARRPSHRGGRNRRSSGSPKI
jgi:ATP-dependent RNA helicase RhlE